MSVSSRGQQFSEIQVSGGSIATFIDLTTDPTLIGLFTSSLDDTFIDLTPVVIGAQSASLTLTPLNGTSDNWLGFSFMVDSGASFAAEPTLGPGEALGSIAPGSQKATLPIEVPAFTSTSFDLELNILGQTRLTVTPLVPEPATTALLGLLALSGLRTGRAR
ncbi:MAG: PEP-CTERM sorting domain-containing protein [Planctomycetota bacterium]